MPSTSQSVARRLREKKRSVARQERRALKTSCQEAGYVYDGADYVYDEADLFSNHATDQVQESQQRSQTRDRDVCIEDFYETHLVAAVEMPKDFQIQVYFKDHSHALCLEAFGDCCSESWFEYVRDFWGMVGKCLRVMDDDGQHQCGSINNVELPSSHRQDYDKNTRCAFLMTDGSEYPFFLRNSSNGYYSGWYTYTFPPVATLLPPYGSGAKQGTSV